MKHATSAIIITLVCASASFTAQRVLAQTTGAPSPLDQLDDFVGDGICTGHVMAMGSKPGHDTTGKYHGEKILGGHWIVMHYDQDQSASAPEPYHVVQYLGYDAANQRFVGVVLDNSGSGYATGTSPGLKGDTLTFDNTGSAHGKPASYRDVFTRDSRNGMTGHTGMMRDKHGSWVKTDEETCRKAS